MPERKSKEATWTQYLLKFIDSQSWNNLNTISFTTLCVLVNFQLTFQRMGKIVLGIIKELRREGWLALFPR